MCTYSKDLQTNVLLLAMFTQKISRFVERFITSVSSGGYLITLYAEFSESHPFVLLMKIRLL